MADLKRRRLSVDLRRRKPGEDLRRRKIKRKVKIVIKERRTFLSIAGDIFRSIPVKWKIAFVVLIASVFLIDVVRHLDIGPKYSFQSTATESEASLTTPKAETTIRNVTNQTIHYTIKPFNSGDDPEERTLKIDDIDRFPGDVSMDVVFQRGPHNVWCRIDSGKPYSFRYDEDGDLDLFPGAHGRADAADLAPFVSTPMSVVEKMLEMAKVDENDVVYDLGCGDGRIVIMAAKSYGARGVGIDIDPELIRLCNAEAKRWDVEDLVEFRLEDVMKANFTEATVVTLYLLTESNAQLRPLFDLQLKPSTYVVSHNYSIPRWKSKQIALVTLMAEDGEAHDIYLYQK